MKEVDARHQAELERLNDQVSKLENENFKKAQTIKLQEIEKHQVDLRLVELAEALKTEKITAEKHMETLNREKELDIIKITEDLSQLKTELSRAENVNLDLLQEVRDLKQLRDKYEDLKAEWLTLKQTNTEFKRTLGDKVKETMRMQREYELFRQKHDMLMSELSSDNEARLQMIGTLQQERDSLKEHICSLEGIVTVKERELKKATEQHEESISRVNRDLRQALEELQIAHEHTKTGETERLELKKKLASLEDYYKRDTELFRTEAMKRDHDIEQEKVKCVEQLQKSRSQVDMSVEFVLSIRKDLTKLLKQVESK